MIDKIAELRVGILRDLSLSDRMTIDKLMSLLSDNGYIIVRAVDTYGETYYDIGIERPNVVYVPLKGDK